MNFSLMFSRRFFALGVLLTLVSGLSAATQTAKVAFSALGISGSFNVKIDTSSHALVNVLNVDLVIDGHKYKIKDIGFIYDEVHNVNYIGGRVTGVDQLSVGVTDDFLIFWKPKIISGYFSFANAATPDPQSGFAEVIVTPRAID
ncbi:MAG: hypothetical protein ABIZ04_25830 [Opitutus sp.]